jgi:hypothetical protein
VEFENFDIQQDYLPYCVGFSLLSKYDLFHTYVWQKQQCNLTHNAFYRTKHKLYKESFWLQQRKALFLYFKVIENHNTNVWQKMEFKLSMTWWFFLLSESYKISLDDSSLPRWHRWWDPRTLNLVNKDSTTPNLWTWKNMVGEIKERFRWLNFLSTTTIG